MTNFEKYKDEILKIAEEGYSVVAVKKGKPIACDNLPECRDCDLDDGGKGNCLFCFLEWGYKDDGEERDCRKCKYYDEGDTTEPCEHCKRYYLDKFEPKPKRTRRDEFLEHYPNANVLGIQPCSIEKENFGEYCGEYDECYECVDDYWSQEVE